VGRFFGRGPATSVVTDEALDDTALRDVRDAVLATGDWRPAADLLERTAPERRADRVHVLADAVVPDPRWADRWLDRFPDDPTALVVRGRGEIARAFDARGAAEEPTGDPTDVRDRLRRAGELCAAAVDRAPRDPEARVALLQLALYRGEDAAGFTGRWERLAALDPLHRRGHEVAMEYWSARCLTGTS
jgi:hypothetical protein